MDKGLVRVEEAAAFLSLGRSKTYELIQLGELRAVKIGRATRVPMAALRQYAERLATEASGELPSAA